MTYLLLFSQLHIFFSGDLKIGHLPLSFSPAPDDHYVIRQSYHCQQMCLT